MRLVSRRILDTRVAFVPLEFDAAGWLAFDRKALAQAVDDSARFSLNEALAALQ